MSIRCTGVVLPFKAENIHIEQVQVDEQAQRTQCGFTVGSSSLRSHRYDCTVSVSFFPIVAIVPTRIILRYVGSRPCHTVSIRGARWVNWSHFRIFWSQHKRSCIWRFLHSVFQIGWEKCCPEISENQYWTFQCVLSESCCLRKQR